MKNYSDFIMLFLLTNNIISNIWTIPKTKNVICRLNLSAINPHKGNIQTIQREKIMLSIEIIVALCSDGINLFNDVDCIGYSNEFT